MNDIMVAVNELTLYAVKHVTSTRIYSTVFLIIQAIV